MVMQQFLACCMDMHMQALRTTFDHLGLGLGHALRFSGLSDKKSGIPQKKNVYLMEKSGFYGKHRKKMGFPR